MSSSSSLSTTARNSFKSSHLSSSSFALKSKFIWRFPPLKFDYLPSCISKRSSSCDSQPVTIDDELLLRQQLSILIYELGSHLNVYVQIFISITLLSFFDVFLDHLRVFTRLLFTCIDSLCYIHFNNV